MTAKWVTYLPANFGDPLCSTFESVHRQTDRRRFVLGACQPFV